MDKTYNSAIKLFEQQKYQKAYKLLANNVAPKDQILPWHIVQAICAYIINKPEEAISLLEQNIKLNNTHLDSYQNLCKMLLESKHYQKLEQLLTKAPIEISQNNMIQYYSAKLMQVTNNQTAAQEIFEKLWHQHNDYESALELAIILQNNHQYESAINLLNTLIAQQPTIAALSNLASLHLAIGKLDIAKTLLQQILEHEKTNPDILYNYAYILLGDERNDDVIQLITNSMQYTKAHIGCQCLLARALEFRKDYEQAYLVMSDLYTLYPDDLNVVVLLLFYSLTTFKWQLCDELHAKIDNSIKHTDAKNYHFSHFHVLHICQSQEQTVKLSVAAEKADNAYIAPENSSIRDKSPTDKIRIGYISSDFNNHVVGMHMLNLLKAHDSHKFEIILYDTSARNDEQTTLIYNTAACVHTFYDKPTEECIAILQNSCDLLVDLTGHTGISSRKYLCQKPAPVQIHMLGDISPLGVNYLDYSICANTLIPNEALKPLIHEKYIHFKNTPFPIATNTQAPTKTKEQLNLPSDKIILACFAQYFRYTPKLFSTWLNVLAQNKQAVLWLQLECPKLRQRLLDFADNHNQTAEQIIFCEKVINSEHNWLQHADIYLTPEYLTCFTTSLLALSHNIPTVGLRGWTNYNYVTTSYMLALECDDLLAKTHHELEQILNHLLTNPNELQLVQQKINTNKQDVLLNTPLFVEKLEHAYQTIWQRYQQGLAPTDLFYE